MGDIYANASRVLVWIGESVRNEVAKCFDLIRKTNILLDVLYLQYQAVEEIPPIQCQEIFDTNPPLTETWSDGSCNHLDSPEAGYCTISGWRGGPRFTTAWQP